MKLKIVDNKAKERISKRVRNVCFSEISACFPKGFLMFSGGIEKQHRAVMC